MKASRTDPTPSAPVNWPWPLTGTPFVSSDVTPWRGALLRGWRGSSALMVQPPLDQHYVVMHLDGAKYVTRRRDGCTVSTLAENGSLTVVPAGTAYIWRTQGPIAFAHLYLEPGRLEGFLARELDADARGASLIDGVGTRDVVLEPLFARLLQAFQTTARPSTLLLDSLLESFMARLAHKYVCAPLHHRARAVALAPHRQRRVTEFIEAHLGEDLALADLAAAAGSSQSHFSRAFHLATGRSPCRYLLERRVERARAFLLTTTQTIEQIAVACGFNSRRQFAVMFKRSVGVGPKRFQMSSRSTPRALPSGPMQARHLRPH